MEAQHDRELDILFRQFLDHLLDGDAYRVIADDRQYLHPPGIINAEKPFAPPPDTVEVFGSSERSVIHQFFLFPGGRMRPPNRAVHIAIHAENK